MLEFVIKQQPTTTNECCVYNEADHVCGTKGECLLCAESSLKDDLGLLNLPIIFCTNLSVQHKVSHP